MCGSRKFKDYFDVFALFFRKRNVVVNYPNFHYQRKKTVYIPELMFVRSPAQRLRVSGLVHTHIQKIRETAGEGGVCLIVNPLPKCGQKLPFGYIGDNTILEIGVAITLGMRVLMLRPFDEVSIMSVVPADDKSRFFVLVHPKLDPCDPDVVWPWLRRFLNGS
ncbi:MAG: hypothetical protein A3I24_00125 [Candidatus Harrisonbacteria bacterium RIFCSPLOWO2_02_FULL_41_13b]|uniref:Uncharacterized protein n=1 Tax=Candidatus Harrisonbacteria bacterium RIFCSPLOWO2_02_FULL_41_13b TaxID=1798409 RepID=A0A1G1ZSG0_9BACT|nr:MAG: hypothetical protein A3J53_00830 [Candidatus Harrisonbacteria bacterium RIFCSPHIGHO2_02_FULL_40_20]OGY67492.1 MAG: hypothetical protein A3I24_00125 [Candidatus Harrisonbacteria bacterium RIFCSPLOWO2_02_FULL_41_13b]